MQGDGNAWTKGRNEYRGLEEVWRSGVVENKYVHGYSTKI